MARRKSNREKNLMKRGGTWYVEAIVDGLRVKKSLRTRIKEKAIQRRGSALHDAIAERKRAAEPEPEPETPRFADLVADALAASKKDHAYRTHADYEKALATDGPIIPWLGNLRVDAIKSSDLRAWWEDANRSVGTKTGRNRLDAIAWVLEFAVEVGHIELDQKTKPLSALRRTLHRRSKTKRAAPRWTSASVRSTKQSRPSNSDGSRQSPRLTAPTFWRRCCSQVSTDCG